nr:hypothetical protein [Brevundimonas diminuta]
MPGQYDRSAKTTRPYLWADGQHLATAGAGSLYLPAGLPFHLQVDEGQRISFIRAGTTDGALSILPVR